MKLKIKSYRNAKNLLIKKYQKSGSKKAQELAVFSGVHFIALYIFLNEEFPCKQFEDKIKSLKKFYQVKEIINE